MEFLKKRFIDNTTLVKKANSFVVRNHFGQTTPLFVAYFLAFIFSALMAFLFEGNPLLMTGVFLIFFCVACLVNSFYLKKFTEINNAIEFQNAICTAALRGDCEYCLIFNEDGDVVYADPRLQTLSTSKVFKNVSELDMLLSAFHVSPEKTQMIHDVVYRNKYEGKSSEPAHAANKHDRSVILKPFHIDEGDFSIAVWSLERPNGFTTIKISRIDEEQEISSIVEDIAVGFYELDHMGHISKANEYLAKMLGYNKTELLNLDIKLDTLVNKEESMDSLISNPKMANALLGNWQGFLTLKTKFKEHIHTFVIQKSFFKANGQVDRIIGYVIKLQDDSLMVKSKGVEKGWIDYSWKCFFENSPYPVSILDKSGLILKINRSFEDILPASFLGKEFNEIFKDEDKVIISKQIDDIVSKNDQPIPIKNAKVKDSERVLDVYLGKILDLNGDTYGFMVRIADITQQLELENSLSHAQRMQTIGHLVGSVAHDFNNLLTAIAGFCDLLFMRHTVGDPSFSHIMQIKQSSDRATNLVRRLLAFSRKQTLKPQIINPSELFADFSSLIQRLIGSEVNFTQKIDPNIWTLKVDPVQMEQVILNLVVNAHHAMENGGNLEIRVKNTSLQQDDIVLRNLIAPAGEGLPPAGEYVCIEVEDTGSGIPHDIIMKIFEPFFTTKSEKSGTGLGLSTVYGIVHQSEGYIYVKSVVGKGTTFVIYFKRHHLSLEEQIDLQKIEQDKIIEDAQNKLDYSGKGLIALIEDEDAVRLFAKSVLISKGYDVIEFNSAKLALERIHEDLSKIDLIISDVMMPEMTGPAFISELHKIKPDIKVIFVSGYGEEAFSEEYGDKRDFNFIPKPFSLKQLVAKVKEVLGN
jgi:two-component system, cell cycle sensor histidine kinase and response regulator CckA